MTQYTRYLSKAAQKVLSRLQSADMVFRNGGRGLVWLLRLAIIPCSPHIRAKDIRVIRNFVTFCVVMAKRSGVKYLVLYLKSSQVLLQQAVGGYRLPSTRPLKCAVSRSRSGLPRIIPREDRLAILARRPREVRFWMTLLGLYRVLGFVGRVSFDTITKPGKVIPGEAIVGFQRFIHEHFFKMASARYGSNAMLSQAVLRNRKGKIDLWTDFVRTLRPVLFPIPKAGAIGSTQDLGVSSSLSSLQAAAQSWFKAENSGLLSRFTEWLNHTGQPVRLVRDTRVIHASRVEYSSSLLNLMRQMVNWKEYDQHRSGPLGRLALKEEAAGKIRVFAMADAFTQWALYPLHEVIMSTLRSWSTDGTFDQLAPVRRLLKNRSVSGLWSYDLSAATDRLPLQFQKVVLQPILGIHGAEVWGDILTKRDYHFKQKSYRYAVGQPMGAYSSWAMLALTHHALVQWAFYRYCARIGTPYRWFELYAVLGDDIIIGHSGVASEYLAVMDTLGVEIGLAKSLVSPTRLVGEFAKKFFIPRDVSMVPLKEVVSARFNGQELLQFVRKYGLDVIQALTFRDMGYRVKGALNKDFSKLGNHVSNLLLALSYPSSPCGVGLLSWLNQRGFGQPNKKMKQEDLKTFLEIRSADLLERIKGRLEERKQVFQMMMVKRDHGQRFNPYDHLWPLYELVLAKLDGYTYELALIEKEAKAINAAISPDLSIYHKIDDLERRIDELPKPDDFTTRPSGVPRVVAISKVTRLWRKMFNIRNQSISSSRKTEAEIINK